MRKILFFAFLFWCCLGTSSYALQFVEETRIDGALETIEEGTIIQTESGHIFKVNDYVYLYPYLYFPKVIILSDGLYYQLIINGLSKALTCSYLGGIGNISTSGSVIKSQIEGSFEGYDDNKIYVLSNGQIWRQIEYKYKYSYKYSPKVIIYKDGSTYYMKVDGMDESVKVERLK